MDTIWSYPEKEKGKQTDLVNKTFEFLLKCPGK